MKYLKISWAKFFMMVITWLLIIINNFGQLKIPQVTMGVITNLPPSNTRNLDKRTMILSAPEMIFPEDGANEMPIIPGFVIKTVENANRYELQVSISESFDCNFLYCDIISNSYMEFVNPLPADSLLTFFPGIRSMNDWRNNTKYYWHVRALSTVNNEESPWSQTNSYKTKINGNTIEKPILIYPIKNSVIPWIDVNFQWYTITSANFYQIQWNTSSSSFSDSFSYESLDQDESNYKTNLKPINDYYSRIIAFNDNSISQFSLTRDFSTGNNVTLNKDKYTFDDGSGSENYRNNIELFWLIKPQNGGNITLTFSSFDTEKDYDFVTIYDGEEEERKI